MSTRNKFVVTCRTEGLNPWKVIDNLKPYELPGGIKIEPYRKDPSIGLRYKGRCTLCLSDMKYSKEPFQLLKNGTIIFWAPKDEIEDFKDRLAKALKMYNDADFEITEIKFKKLQEESKDKGKELRIPRKHVLSIASGLKAIVSYEFNDYMEYALQHLESGYQEILKLIEFADNNKLDLNKRHRYLDEFKNRVKELALSLEQGLRELNGKCKLCGWQGDEKRLKKLIELIKPTTLR